MPMDLGRENLIKAYEVDKLSLPLIVTKQRKHRLAGFSQFILWNQSMLNNKISGILLDPSQWKKSTKPAVSLSSSSWDYPPGLKTRYHSLSSSTSYTWLP